MKLVAARAWVLIMFACSSCAIALPVVTGVAGSSPVVEQYLEQGEGDSFWIARYDYVVEAALGAGDKLSLKLKDKKIEKIMRISA